jgi:uncharacterized protein (TIGR02284 family)
VEYGGGMNIFSSKEQRSLDALYDVFASCASTLRAARESIEDKKLRKRILCNEKVWRNSADQLRPFVNDGAEPARIGTSVVESLRQTWMKVKSAVGDTQAIKLECDRREAEARRTLEATYSSGWPLEVREVLEEVAKHTDNLPSLL